MSEDQFLTMVVQALKTLGLPASFTAFAIWGAWRIARWVSDGCSYLGQTVVVPLIGRITKFIDSLDGTLDRHSQSLEGIVDKLDSIKSRQEEQGRILKQIHERTHHDPKTP